MNKQLQYGGLLAVGMAGIAGGFSVGGLFKRLRRPTPNQILSQVKRAFLKEAPIEGSWIEMKNPHYKSSHCARMSTMAALPAMKMVSWYSTSFWPMPILVVF